MIIYVLLVQHHVLFTVHLCLALICIKVKHWSLICKEGARICSIVHSSWLGVGPFCSCLDSLIIMKFRPITSFNLIKWQYIQLRIPTSQAVLSDLTWLTAWHPYAVKTILAIIISLLMGSEKINASLCKQTIDPSACYPVYLLNFSYIEALQAGLYQENNWCNNSLIHTMRQECMKPLKTGLGLLL